MNKKVKINQPLKIIEFFTGIGIWKSSLNEDFQIKTKTILNCEWNYNSIKAYNLIHYKKDFEDFKKSFLPDKKNIIESILKYDITFNNKKLITKKSLINKTPNKLVEILQHLTFSKIYTNNIFDINNIYKEINLGPQADILFYSPLCQDISTQNTCGLGLNGPKSSLIFKIIDYLNFMKIEEDSDNMGRDPDNIENWKHILPKILVMENVPQIISKKNINLFNKFTNELNKIGYSSSFRIIRDSVVGGRTIRKRLFLISVKNNCKIDWSNSIPQKMVKYILNIVLKGVSYGRKK